MANITRLVDTSILVDFLRGSLEAKDWLNQFQQGELALSVVTAAELIAGCRNRDEQILVEKELTLYSIIWLSGGISLNAFNWYRQFHLSHGIGFLDCLIGASAYQYELLVCTLNDKHFRPLPNVRAERPY